MRSGALVRSRQGRRFLGHKMPRRPHRSFLVNGEPLGQKSIVRPVNLPEAIPELARARRGVGVLCSWQHEPPFDIAALSPLQRWQRTFWAIWRSDDRRRLPVEPAVRMLQAQAADARGLPAAGRERRRRGLVPAARCRAAGALGPPLHAGACR